MARGGLLLVSACLGLAAAARGDDPPRLLLPPAPAASSTLIQPVSHEDIDLPPTKPPEPEPRAPEPRIPPQPPEPRNPPPEPRTPPPAVRKRAAGLVPPDGSKTVPAGLIEAAPTTERRRAPDSDGIDDFLGRRTPADRGRKDRSSGKMGDKLGGLFDKDDGGHRSWFRSDHGFDQFASPVTNPFLFEDPRATTEVRPEFIYQKIPSSQPNFQGGNLWFVGLRGSVAITERFSLTVNKLGGVGVYPSGSSPLDSNFGFAELWLGPKVTIYRDPEYGSILSGGAIFQIPVGSSNVYQDTGALSIAPYLSGGQTFLRSRLGSLNGLATVGYSVATNRGRSDYFYASGHLDFDVGDYHRFYPLLELNWFQYTTNGTSSAISAEGRDLINFGSAARGSDLLTWALGGRVKLTESAQIGAAFEMPLLGNRDLFRYRFTLDFILRY